MKITFYSETLSYEESLKREEEFISTVGNLFIQLGGSKADMEELPVEERATSMFKWLKTQKSGKRRSLALGKLYALLRLRKEMLKNRKAALKLEIGKKSPEIESEIARLTAFVENAKHNNLTVS